MSSPISLMPHAVCWKADPRLIWTMVVTNGITFLSYLSICLSLLYITRRTRRVMARDWVWFTVGFALFIVACGSTHLMEVVTTWLPFFWIDAATNIITAVLSALVAINLIRRAGVIGFSINDYAARLANTESEQARMREALLAAQKLEDWSRMSTVVAHEIANPLEAIQNLLYLIRSSDNIPDDVLYLAETASQESERVITISRNTLSFFRQGPDPERLDLRHAADSVCYLLETVMHRQHLKIKIEAEGDTIIDALPGAPRQVLLNLVRNACEATSRPGADVRIQLQGKPSGVEVRVIDQGSGIDPALLTTLFHFGVSTKGERGNGMGLWAARQTLIQHGGTIRVESRIGEGTSFILFWPRVYSAPTAPTAETRAAVAIG
jgi:signal transduction histidine kinase